MANPYSSILRQLHEAQMQAPPPREPVQRQPRKKAPVYSSSSESEDESSSSEYMSGSDIDNHFEEEPCQMISPAGLSSKKTKKEKLAYLKEKNCPRVPDLKKKSKPTVSKMETVVVAPEQVKKVRVVKKKVAEAAPAAAAAAVVSEPAAPAKRVKKVKAAAPAPVVEAPAAPAAPAAGEKKKRPASAYALCVGKHRKAGLSFGDAAKAAKAECDAKKGK